jgi:hypothetical protein
VALKRCWRLAFRRREQQNGIERYRHDRYSFAGRLNNSVARLPAFMAFINNQSSCGAMKTVRLEQLGFESLARLVKSKFRVWVGANDALELELYEATSPHVTPAGGGTEAVFESFSLLFLGPVDRLLPQRSYAFECEALGKFDLFIVPIGRDQSGVRYEAVFNRLTKRNSL